MLLWHDYSSIFISKYFQINLFALIHYIIRTPNTKLQCFASGNNWKVELSQKYNKIDINHLEGKKNIFLLKYIDQRIDGRRINRFFIDSKGKISPPSWSLTSASFTNDSPRQPWDSPRIKLVRRFPSWRPLMSAMVNLIPGKSAGRRAFCIADVCHVRVPRLPVDWKGAYIPAS